MTWTYRHRKQLIITSSFILLSVLLCFFLYQRSYHQKTSKPEKKKKHTSGNCDHQEDCDELARRIAVRVNEIYSDDYKAIVARNSIYSDVISHYWLNKAFDKSDLQSQISLKNCGQVYTAYSSSFIYCLFTLRSRF